MVDREWEDAVKGGKVLLVEDLALQLNVLEKVFIKAGFSAVTTLNDSREVLDRHGEEHFDLLVLDLEMPHLDGFQVMEGLRQRFPDDPVPVLVTTAHDDRDNRLRALRMGAWDFLAKPLDREETVNRAKNLLKVRMLQKKLGRGRPVRRREFAEERLNARILVVDDNQIHVKVLTRIIQQEGYRHVTGVTDPREVSTLYLDRGERFDLVILDLQMPHWDGFQVIELVREMDQRDFLPILVTTADQDRENRLRALEVGAQDCLEKPLDRAEVLARMRNLLDMSLMLHHLEGG